MSSLPDLIELSHTQKDELMVWPWAQLLKQEERIVQLEARLKLGSRNSSDGTAKALGASTFFTIGSSTLFKACPFSLAELGEPSSYLLSDL